MSIRTRIICVALLVVMVLSGLYTYYFIHEEGMDEQNHLRKTIAENNRLLKVVAAGPLYDGDREELNNILDSFFSHADMTRLVLQERGGDIRIARTRQPAAAGGAEVESRVVIVRGADELGDISTTYSTARIEEKLRQSRNKIILFSCALLLLLSIAIWLVAGGLTGPIARLTAAARAMADGDLDQEIEPGGARELQSLGQSFIRMRDAIRVQMADLRDSSEKFNQLTRNISEVFWIGSPDWQEIWYISPAYETLWGRSRQSLYARPLDWLDAILEEDRAAMAVIFAPDLPERLKTATVIDFPEYRIVRPDGTNRWIHARAFPVRDEAGQVYRIAGLAEDITERKLAAEAIQQLNAELDRRVMDRTAQLEAAIREQESFSYSVSHDLRAPLRHINSYSTIVMDDFGKQIPPEACQYLDRIAKASGRMGQLIDDLLELSRVGRTELHHQTVILSRSAAKVVAMLRETEPERNVTWLIADGLTAQGDATLLQQVLENLLGNAWKYTAREPQARIEFGRTTVNGEAAFFVRDNGAGFDMAYIDKLFRPFQRLHTDAEFEGTGIGLATVQRIIQRHGGKVWAEGNVNEGATFYFTLPEA